MIREFWRIEGYPQNFEAEGIRFWLVRETPWLRIFRSNAPLPAMRRMVVSRVMDESVQATVARARLNAPDLSAEEREEILLALHGR